MVDPRQALEQERSADYQAYAVSGSRREVGRQMGAHLPALGPPAASLHPDHLAFARACRDEVARFYPSGAMADAYVDVLAVAADTFAVPGRDGLCRRETRTSSTPVGCW